jgi:hypothetical protein
MASDVYEPEINAGLGLIYRLNAWWELADRRALSGNLLAWELVLDRIFSNLIYRNDVEVEISSTKKVTIKITDDEMVIWETLKKDIESAVVLRMIAQRNKNLPAFLAAKKKHYHAIMKYDWWLRKFMHSLKLYMKESDSNPSQALFGRKFGNKR